MTDIIKRFIFRSKLFAPIGTAITLAILIITIQSISNSKEGIYDSLEKSLTLEVETIIKMFEREKSLKLEKVKTHLKFAHDYFYSSPLTTGTDSIEIEAQNQETGQSNKIWIKDWKLNNLPVHKNFSFVDKIKDLTGGTATIFQKIDSGYVRISTNVPRLDSSRAINTYIPNTSPVVQAIEKGETFFGRAYVVNDWYITAYEPIEIKGKPLGILYVGNKEKDLPELRKILNSLKIGTRGKLKIIDNQGNIVIGKDSENENWAGKDFFKTIIENKKGIIHDLDQHQKDQIIVYDYFPDFELFVTAMVSPEDETQDLVRSTVMQSAIYGLIIFIILSLFVFFITTEKIRKYVKQIEDSNDKLSTTREALEHSELKFRTLFNSSSDEIFVSDFQGHFIEINQVACDSLEYSREDLLKMKFIDIKTKKYKQYVYENIKTIIEKGYHTYETEHVSKSGKIIPFEMKSRIIEYDGRNLILSISRNISDRKTLEKKIVQSIIETEMKERKRVSADLHDGLGPVLSTIKLYSDLIKKGNFNKMSLEEAVSNIDELVEMAISTTKEISNNITPSVLDDFGLSVAISEFCSYINRTKSVNIDLDTSKYTFKRSGIETTVLYQIAKELINNTLKHSGAQNIRIQLKSVDNQIILYYRDDGSGFDVEEKLSDGGGLGLNNIVNKIKTLKGTYDFYSDSGKGMFIIISLIVEDEDKKEVQTAQ